MADAASVSLLCLPHAGAGASFFTSWAGLVGIPVHLMPMQLPGREERIDEEPYRDVLSAVRTLESDFAGRSPRPDRVALFGHSFGSVLAFELARRLESRPGVEVVRLFASGSPGPSAPRARRAAGLDDDAFLDRVQEFAGYRHPAFDIPELRSLLLPALRADVLAHEEYAPVCEAPIQAPITCFRGGDDHLVSVEDAAGWRSSTAGGFELVELPGGHMYLVEQAKFLLACILERLTVEP
jgi:surfactin synthase thioesterase subunit